MSPKRTLTEKKTTKGKEEKKDKKKGEVKKGKKVKKEMKAKKESSKCLTHNTQYQYSCANCNKNLCTQCALEHNSEHIVVVLSIIFPLKIYYSKVLVFI